jgi:cytidylate kinase
MERVSEHDGITLAEAKTRVTKSDKKRANYYNFYTGHKWGASERYDATFNTSILGVDKIAEILADMVKRMSNN